MATQYIQDKEGSKFIPASQRPDGSWRKPRRVKEGFIPQEEVPLYESKGKKIIKENQANAGLPAGLTREAWEKMKEAQAKLLNPQQKTAKKKGNKKSNTNQPNTDDFNDNVDLNNVPNDRQVAASSTSKKKKKGKQNNKIDFTTPNNCVLSTGEIISYTSVADDWVTMGKVKPGKKSPTTVSLDKATSAIENLRLDNRKSKQQTVKKRIDQLAVSKGVDELANDMLIDEDHEEDNEETKIKEKNNEKQQLVKKIKTLKKKLKDVETLKELSKQKSLDKEQREKVNKADQFAKDLTKLQAKLDQINSDK